MDFTSTRIPYSETKYFSKIILDYLSGADALKPFYEDAPTIEGLRHAIETRKQAKTDRQLLVSELSKQYSEIDHTVAVRENIQKLGSGTTFTIVTAHQPNIFTGPLYTIYKIIHAIKLAACCKTIMAGYDFVPVFYMGSEDADLAELGHFYLLGEKVEWKTKQTGAVGRMKVDKEFQHLISRADGQLSVLPNGAATISLIRDSYREGSSIQDATFRLLNALFGEMGLVVLIPDNANLKRQAAKIFEDDLLEETASRIVEQSALRLEAAGYRLQANPREINLFYLEHNLRDRIVRVKDQFATKESGLTFTKAELLEQLSSHPERFSPNVILRGIYQEIILPNIVYIGGGGEIAYWLQLRDLFHHYNIPYPVLLLRDSFLVVEKKWNERMGKLGFDERDFFASEQELLNRLVARETKNEIKLNGNFVDAEKLYESLRKQAVAVDTTLAKHVDALKAQSFYRLQELEKKMLRAEKRKFNDQQRQIHAIKEKLFPNNELQERVDNFMYYHAKWGMDFIRQVYAQAPALENEFVLLNER